MDTAPVISAKQVNINKKSADQSDMKYSDSFTVTAKNGATAQTPVIESIKTGRTTLTAETGLEKFQVIANADGSYDIAIDSVFLNTIRNNTVYEVTLKTTINGIPEIGETEEF